MTLPLRVVVRIAPLSFIFLASPLAGQTVESPLDACIRSIPRSDFKRVLVSLQASVDTDAQKPIAQPAEFIAQAVALRIRELLGGRADQIPEADSAVEWRSVDGTVTVWARRDGTVRWYASDSFFVAEPGSGVELLGNALRDVVAGGERFAWPESFAADSSPFELQIVRPQVFRDGTSSVIKGTALPMFTLDMPWERPVELSRSPRINYPERSRNGRATGGVRLRFTIDSNGKLVPGSIREAWPESLPRPTGWMAQYYDSFMKAVIKGLPTAGFRPLLVGGCPADQRVQQMFLFQLEER